MASRKALARRLAATSQSNTGRPRRADRPKHVDRGGGTECGFCVKGVYTIPGDPPRDITCPYCQS